MAEEIRQRITAEDQASPALRDVAASANRVEAASDSASAAGGRQAEAARQQRDELEQLVREQLAYQQRLDAGEEATDEAQQAEEQRTRRIEFLSGAVAEHERREEAVQQAVRRTVDAHRTAVTVEQSKRDTLERLVREQVGYEQRLAAGERATEESTRAEARRRESIDRLGRELAQQEDAEDRVQREMRQTVEAHRDTQRASDDTRTSTDSTAGAMNTLRTRAGQLAGALGVGSVLGTAIQSLRAEFQQLIDLQEKAFAVQIDLAGAERELNLNLATATPEERQEAFATVERIARERNLPQAQTTLAFAQAISAAGGDVELAGQQLDLAAQLFPNRPTELGQFAGAIGDVQSAVGTDDPLEALGFLGAIAGTARPTNFRNIAQNAPTAVRSVVGREFDFEAGGALFSAITKAIGGEQSSEQARTATINFAEQLQSFFVDQNRPERGVDAIAALRQDDALRSEFIDGLAIEAAASRGVEEIVTTGESGIGAVFDDALRRIESRDLAEVGQTTLENINAGNLQVLGEVQRALQSAQEQAFATNQEAALAGLLREEFPEVLRANGLSNLATRLESADFELSTGFGQREALQNVIDAFSDQASTLLEARRGLGVSGQEVQTVFEVRAGIGPRKLFVSPEAAQQFVDEQFPDESPEERARRIRTGEAVVAAPRPQDIRSRRILLDLVSELQQAQLQIEANNDADASGSPAVVPDAAPAVPPASSPDVEPGAASSSAGPVPGAGAGAGTWAERQRQLEAMALMTPEELASAGGRATIHVDNRIYGQVFQGRRDPFVVRALEGRRNV